MSVESVKEYLKQFTLAERVREFAESTATVEEAARVNRCEPARIAKSLSFILKDHAIIIVVAGDGKISNQKFKSTFQTKAKMISGDQVESLVGHPVGGVCPFDLREEVGVYLDVSLKRFETVLPACGTSNSAIEVTLEELEKASNYIKWVDICQERKENEK